MRTTQIVFALILAAFLFFVLKRRGAGFCCGAAVVAPAVEVLSAAQQLNSCQSVSAGCGFRAV
jgi:K+ transporter